MNTLKLVSILLLIIINISCGDCDDEDEIRNQEQNKAKGDIQKDSLNVMFDKKPA